MKRDRRLFALVGSLLGLGAPLGWLFWRALLDQPMWLRNEFQQFGAFYVYLALATVTVFTLFGYFLGRHSDVVGDQSASVKETLRKVNLLAITDALTNIYNARYLHEQLSIETEAAKRYHTPLTCLMMDIDNFKSINDRFGHPAGDVVLATLAKIVQQSVRRVDIVGRLGGEEFLVIMPHTAQGTAFRVAERIRQAVQRWPFKLEGVAIPVTVSIGVACLPTAGIANKSTLMKAADNALYEAKKSGKNRSVVSQFVVSPPVGSVK